MDGCWNKSEARRNSHVEGTATAAEKTGHEAAEPAKENAEAESCEEHGHEREEMIEPTAGQQLDKMITGYWVSQAIYAAAKFGIADHLKDGPRPVDDLAAATSTNSDALYRLLRALASIGIFAECEPRQFSLTPLAEPLQSDIPGSKRALALMSGDEQFHAWAEIEFSILTGSTAFEKVYGKPIFEYLGEHPDKARIFDAAMVGIHGRESDDILDAYDFSSMSVVADLGGGNGSQIINLLKRYPNLKGILFDLPHVIERAKKQIESAGLADRCELVGGDFFDAVPNGADAYMMRHIIHDWDDNKSLTILRNCHRAMSPDSKLLVVESVIPAGNEPFGGKFLDLVMLLIPGGKERTADEYRELFDAAQFDLSRVVPTSGEISIVEGSKR
jgi:ubiquinone/menaquinone biosynthesis C-methylase UbiE